MAVLHLFADDIGVKEHTTVRLVGLNPWGIVLAVFVVAAIVLGILSWVRRRRASPGGN